MWPLFLCFPLGAMGKAAQSQAAVLLRLLQLQANKRGVWCRRDWLAEDARLS